MMSFMECSSWMKAMILCCLYGEDSGEFTLVKAECLRQCSPGSTEEDGVKLTVVLKEDSQAFGDGEDGMADFGELSRAVRYVLPSRGGSERNGLAKWLRVALLQRES